MRLIVTDDSNMELGFDTVIMSSSEFNNICSHPYIASSHFDAVVVDLSCKIRLGYLSQVAGITLVVPKVTRELNGNSVSILSELYQERAAELRINFMRDKAKFFEIVTGMEEQYRWKDYY